MRIVVVAALLGALAAPADALAARCDVSGKERRLGATYVTRLAVTGVSCGSGERVVRAFHRCRRSRGGRGSRCTRVDGWRCRERRLRAASTQYDARVGCRRGSRRVDHDYTQFT